VSPDVLVVTPADPDFDSELAGLLGDQIQVIKQLEPYVLIVTNRSKRKIVAYSPAWTVTGRYLHGSGQIFNLSLKYPDAVAGTSIGNQFPRGDEIYPGETRIATQGVAGDKTLSAMLNSGGLNHTGQHFSSNWPNASEQTSKTPLKSKWGSMP
jgi:hypothetical protein